jgi:Xaa-Pro aminopeptidase
MRLNLLRKNIENNNCFPYAIFDLKNIKYLTGFDGSNAYLIVDRDNTYFITDSRYEEYAVSILSSDIEFVLQDSSFINIFQKLSGRLSSKKIFLEKHSVTLETYSDLSDKNRKIDFVPADNYVNQMRIVKDDAELDILREAAKITDKCVKHLQNLIKPGLTEWDLVIEIEYFYKKNGCIRTSFDSIVASGKGASMPHYTPSMTKKIRKGEMILIDMGCEYNGYNSDLTRTFFLDSVPDEFCRIYQVVQEAQQAAIQAVAEGVKASELDSIARTLISDAGYGKYFGHSLGHGIGIDVHELPSVNKSNESELAANTIISIEPGIYLPQKGGVRIEDMVRVTSHGCEVLTKSPKDIIII